ncbi:MAG: hypothetical protein ABIH59_01340 [archaeon]
MSKNIENSRVDLGAYADYAKRCGELPAGLTKEHVVKWFKSMLPQFRGLEEIIELNPNYQDDPQLRRKAQQMLKNSQSIYFDLKLGDLNPVPFLMEFGLFERTLEKYGALGTPNYFFGDDDVLGEIISYRHRHELKKEFQNAN